MKTRWTISLVAVFAALAGLYWWTGRQMQQEVRDAFEARRVFESPVESVTSIGIELAGEGPVEASRTADGWAITQPYAHIEANDAAWDRIAGVLTQMTNERGIESTLEDPSVYGLDPPGLRVFVGIAGSVEQVDFGQLDPTQGFRYTRTADQGVFLSPASVYEELNKPLLALRDRSVLRASEGGFAKIIYYAAPNAERPAPFEVEIERQETGAWQIVKPIQAVASRSRLEALCSELQLLQGRSYVDAPENLGDYGLAQPFARITAVASDGGEQTVHLGWIDDSQEDAGIFVQREGEIPVFVVDVTVVGLLPETVEALREPHLFTREASNLKAFTYRDADREMRLEIDAKGGWKLTNPPADDTDQLAVSAYIAMLKQLGAESYPETAAAPDARITLDFEFGNGEPASQIRIGGPVPGAEPALLYAWADNGTLLALPFQSWVLLDAEPFKFRDKRVFQIETRDAVAVELNLEGARYRFETEAGRWRVASPEGYFFESQDDAQAILDALCGVTGLALVTPRGGNEIHGLDTPLLDAEVWTRSEDGGAKSAGHLYVGSLATEQGRHRFARMAAREDIMVIDQGFVDDLRAALEGVAAR